MNTVRLRIACFSIFAFIVVFRAVPVAADSYDLVTIGARAEAMGGAAIGMADDSTAIFNNPGALAFLRHSEIAASGRILSDHLEKHDDSNTPATFRNTTLSFVGGASPVSFRGHRFSFAMGYYRPIEMVTYYKDSNIHGGIIAYGPGMAMTISPWLSAGLAINIWGGTRDFDRTSEGTTLWWKSTYSGTNATVGLMADFRQRSKALPLRIGLTIRSPFDLKIDYHDRISTQNQADLLSSISYKLEMPWMYGMGIAYDPIVSLTLAGDIETRRFGDRLIIADGTIGHQETPLSASGKNLTPIRIGAEFRVQAGRWQIPLRAGFRTMPTLRADQQDGEATDQVVGSVFSFGSGIGNDRFRIDATYSRSSYDTKSRTAGKETMATRTYQTIIIAGSFRLGGN